MSNKNTINACCFWALVLYGIAIIVSWVLGWCHVADNVIALLNQIAHLILLLAVIFGGFLYITAVRGKYRMLWIFFYVIGLVVGVLGLTNGFFKWW